MSERSRAVIVAPFWGLPGHVGVYRVDRFIRWLRHAGVEVVVVCAGPADAEVRRDWGWEITVRDPLGVHRGRPAASRDGVDEMPPARVRRPPWILRFLGHHLLLPEPGVVWARRAARHPLVVQRAAGARWVLSSSPPESAHVAAWLLARRVRAALVIDFRDGWIDEPLRPLLQRSAVRRWREARVERRILRSARVIFVSSPGWQDMLIRRRPDTIERTVVLTNGCPTNMAPAVHRSDGAAPLTLLYAGQFTASRSTQRAGRLLRPLADLTLDRPGRIRILGRLTDADYADIDECASALAKAGWRIEVVPAVEREEALRQMSTSDGLLLLCLAHAAIPSKFFEYLWAGRPIFAVTPRQSAVWQAAQEVPQVFRAEVDDPVAAAAVAARFVAACNGWTPQPVPQRFTEAHLATVFRTALGLRPVNEPAVVRCEGVQA